VVNKLSRAAVNGDDVHDVGPGWNAGATLFTPISSEIGLAGSETPLNRKEEGGVGGDAPLFVTAGWIVHVMNWHCRR
jgi:hypothetical protein